MRKLIITEKANAARRISTILSDGKSSSATSGGVTVISFESEGDEYKVVSLRGHIIELDYSKEYNDWGTVSPVELVHAPQVKTVRVKSILNTIKSIAEESDEIIIATDYDREGELIGMETVRAIGVYQESDSGCTLDGRISVKRAKFSALTKGEVESAFSDLADPDKKLADAAETRQIVDLSWGAVLTRLISLSSGQVGKNFMSVGRVQSPTLKLLVDRHEEIEKFVPVPFWDVIAKFGMLAFKGSHESNHFWDREEADAIMSRISEEKEGTVIEYEVTEKEEYKPAPFDTTQMQVEANKIGIPPTTAMKLAEDLYTGGYISYPRTENTEYPKTLNLRSVLEKLKDSEFRSEAEEILSQEKIIPSRGKRRTTDHPPIYPTAGASSEKMKGDKWKLYELIVRRFLATVAPNAEAEVTKCAVDVAGEKFLSEGYALKRPGWKKYYKKYLKAAPSKLPAMKVGDKVDIRSLSVAESETQPPFRYNQGSLIQEMDRLQLGTKSTRHDIISKLFSRNYVQGNYMIPTSSGIALTRSLEKHGGGITEPDMTAKLEADMISITSGERTLDEVVKESQDMLYNVAVKISEDSDAIGEEIKTALRTQQHVGICPKCGNDMVIKRSKNGNFIGCNGYPECTNAFPLPKGALIQMTETTCGVCGLPQLKVIRKGNPPSVQCIDPRCPSNVEKNDLGPCPACGKGRIRIMFSKQGKRFAGCSEWPSCTQTYPLRPRGTIVSAKKSCELCKAPMIVFGSAEECINTDCPGRKKASRAKKADPEEKTAKTAAKKTVARKKTTKAVKKKESQEEEA
ncbi:MAG: DNA topoisomerase I [Candidatus Methanomethylophilaceae archaeon]|nr:DNA topoisomerase I [Candidatus Methanomethylophilaceae archaeon]